MAFANICMGYLPLITSYISHIGVFRAISVEMSHGCKRERRPPEKE